MSIEDKIRQIAEEQFAGFSYVFEDWYDADARLDTLPLPAIICIMPVSGSTLFRNGRAYDTENIALAFVDKVARDANGEDNKRTYVPMKEAGMSFIQAINESGWFVPLEGEQYYDVIYEQLSSIVSGVMYNLTLKSTEALCL